MTFYIFIHITHNSHHWSSSLSSGSSCEIISTTIKNIVQSSQKIPKLKSLSTVVHERWFARACRCISHINSVGELRIFRLAVSVIWRLQHCGAECSAGNNQETVYNVQSKQRAYEILQKSEQNFDMLQPKTCRVTFKMTYFLDTWPFLLR